LEARGKRQEARGRRQKARGKRQVAIHQILGSPEMLLSHNIYDELR